MAPNIYTKPNSTPVNYGLPNKAYADCIIDINPVEMNIATDRYMLIWADHLGGVHELPFDRDNGTEATYLIRSTDDVGIGTSSPGGKLEVTKVSDETDTINDVLIATHQTNNTAAAGFGAGALLRSENDAGDVTTQCAIRSDWASAASGNEHSNIDILGHRTGALVSLLKYESDDDVWKANDAGFYVEKTNITVGVYPFEANITGSSTLYARFTSEDGQTFMTEGKIDMLTGSDNLVLKTNHNSTGPSIVTGPDNSFYLFLDDDTAPQSFHIKDKNDDDVFIFDTDGKMSFLADIASSGYGTIYTDGADFVVKSNYAGGSSDLILSHQRNLILEDNNNSIKYMHIDYVPTGNGEATFVSLNGTDVLFKLADDTGTNSFGIINSTDTDIFKVRSSGFVGINQSSPVYALDIIGSINTENNSTANEASFASELTGTSLAWLSLTRNGSNAKIEAWGPGYLDITANSNDNLQIWGNYDSAGFNLGPTLYASSTNASLNLMVGDAAGNSAIIFRDSGRDEIAKFYSDAKFDFFHDVTGGVKLNIGIDKTSVADITQDDSLGKISFGRVTSAGLQDTGAYVQAVARNDWGASDKGSLVRIWVDDSNLGGTVAEFRGNSDYDVEIYTPGLVYTEALNAVTEAYQGPSTNHGNLGATKTITIGDNNQRGTWSSNMTITFDPADYRAVHFTFIFQNNATGGYTVAWAGGSSSTIIWLNGEPTWNTAANKYNVVSGYYDPALNTFFLTGGAQE